MVKPKALQMHPPVIVATIGGGVGVILLLAVLNLAPLFGGEAIELAGLVGGVFTGSAEAAFWIGHAIVFILGWIIVAPLLTLAWSALPGDELRLGGALLKGTVAGAALWILAGILLPFLAAVGRAGIDDPGFFAAGAGLASAGALLVAHLLYGIAVAVIGSMARGISPIESLGLMGYRLTGGTKDQSETAVPAR
jgi:hypothetical protein